MKVGEDFKKLTVITEDLLGFNFIFDKEASCVTSSSNVIIEISTFHRQTSKTVHASFLLDWSNTAQLPSQRVTAEITNIIKNTNKGC